MAFKSTVSTNIGTTKETIGTVPSGTTWTIIGMSFANVASEEVQGTAYLYKDSSSTEARIAYAIPIPEGSSILLVNDGQKIVAEENDEIRVESDTTDGVDVVMSYLEN